MKSKVANKPLEARKASPLLVSLSAVFLGIDSKIMLAMGIEIFLA